MKKFKVVSLLLIVVMAFSVVFAGCGKVTPTEKRTEYKEPVFDENKTYNLQFAWWGDTERETATREALDLWNERYPNIQIEGISGGWDGFHDKLRVQLLTGQGGYFQIFQFSPLYLRLFAEGGRLVDLTPYLNKFEAIGPQEDVIWAGMTFNDNQIYALPSGLGAGAMLYNKDTLDKYDIAYPKDDETGDSMNDRYRELTNKARAAGEERMWGSQDPLDTEASGYAGMLQAHDVKPWSDDYLDTNLDTEESLLIFEDLDKLTQEGIFIPTDITVSNASEYLDKYCGYGGTSSSGATSTIAQLKSEIGLVVPAGPNEGYTDYRISGAAIPIALNSRVEDDETLGACLRFLQWFLTSTEAAEKLGFSRGIPPSKVQQDYIAPTLGKVEAEILRINDYVVALGNQPGQREPARIAAFDNVFQVSKDKYFFQGMSIRDFLKEACKNGRPELLKGVRDQ